VTNKVLHETFSYQAPPFDVIVTKNHGDCLWVESERSQSLSTLFLSLKTTSSLVIRVPSQMKFIGLIFIILLCTLCVVSLVLHKVLTISFWIAVAALANCQSSPFSRAQKVKKEFEERYLKQKPFSNYIASKFKGILRKIRFLEKFRISSFSSTFLIVLYYSVFFFRSSYLNSHLSSHSFLLIHCFGSFLFSQGVQLVNDNNEFSLLVILASNPTPEDAPQFPRSFQGLKVIYKVEVS
jgi:hypothetical protein